MEARPGDKDPETRMLMHTISGREQKKKEVGRGPKDSQFQGFSEWIAAVPNQGWGVSPPTSVSLGCLLLLDQLPNTAP